MGPWHERWAVRLTTSDGLRVVSFEEMRVAERHAGRRPAAAAFGRGALRGFAVGAIIGVNHRDQWVRTWPPAH